MRSRGAFLIALLFLIAVTYWYPEASLAAAVSDIAAFSVLGNLIVALVAGIGYGLWSQGSPILFALAFLLVITTTLALGYVLSSRMRRLETAGITSLLLLGCGMLAAGFFPVDGRIPEWLAALLQHLPFPR